MDDPPLASLSLTHVHYDPNDRISYLCAYLALVPQALCIIYVTLIWSSREAEVALMFAGQMASEALNWTLKHYIKEERPRHMHGKGYGMPSSHAQFVAFYSLSLSLFLLVRHQPPSASSHPSPTPTTTTTTTTTNASQGPAAQQQTQQQRQTNYHNPTTLPQRLLVSALSLAGAAAVAWSRVYLGYHSPRQVVAGCATGAAFALAWYAFTARLRSAGWIAWGLDLSPARALRFRDLILTEDLTDAGWARWEQHRQGRGIAGDSKKEI